MLGKSLAIVVRDGSETRECRLAAYAGLFLLRGLSMPSSPGKARSDRSCRGFPMTSIGRSSIRILTSRTRFEQGINSAMIAHLTHDQRGFLEAGAKGVKAYKEGEYFDAVASLGDAIRRYPLAAGAYLMRGDAEFRLGLVDEAIADFTRAIELAPGSSRSYRCRSEAYKKKGLASLADEDLAKALRIENERDKTNR